MYKKTQNSGVVVNASAEGGASYYGKINNMIELDYYGAFKVVFFKCDWVDMRPNKGIKTHRFGLTSVNSLVWYILVPELSMNLLSFLLKLTKFFMLQIQKNLHGAGPS
jgi:Domain of unknown function (DUF4216)